MFRSAFTMASTLSVLLWVATVALWFRSYLISDAFNQFGMDRSRMIWSSGGKVMYYEQDDSAMTALRLWPSGRQPTSRWIYQILTSPDRPDAGDDRWFNRLGIAVDWRAPGPMFGVFSTKPVTEYQTRLMVPDWLIAFLFAFLPAARLVLALRRRRTRRSHSAHGLCPLCGYDLRASKSRCPECGSPLATEV